MHHVFSSETRKFQALKKVEVSKVVGEYVTPFPLVSLSLFFFHTICYAEYNGNLHIEHTFSLFQAILSLYFW